VLVRAFWLVQQQIITMSLRALPSLLIPSAQSPHPPKLSLMARRASRLCRLDTKFLTPRQNEARVFLFASKSFFESR